MDQSNNNSTNSVPPVTPASTTPNLGGISSEQPINLVNPTAESSMPTAPTQTAATPIFTTSSSMPPAGGKSNRMILAIGLGLLTLAVVAGGAAYYMMNMQPAPTPQVQATPKPTPEPTQEPVEASPEADLDAIDLGDVNEDIQTIDTNLQSL